MSNMKVTFDLGETRHVKLLIHSCKGDDFEIVSASYQFVQKGAETPEDEGASVIMEHVIDQVITPKNKGWYNLIVTYMIADETLIENVEVQVR